VNNNEQLLEDAQKVYEDILQTANQFLRNAQLFEIHILRDHNPSYEELARIMHQLATIVIELAVDLDPMLGQKAVDYATIMEKMGLAIRNNDKITLSEQVKLLDKKPFV